MKFSSINLKWLKALILLLIVAHLCSCSSWQVMKEPYNKKIDKEKHKMVKVELVNGKKIELHNPFIQGEDLIGVIITENRERFQKHTVSISLKDIKQMKEIDKTETFLNAFFTVVAIAVIVHGIITFPK